MRHRPPHQYTHTRRVVSKVFPTDFASRKVRTVEAVWNEANSDTERTQSSSSHVVVSVSARWLLRRRQRTKKRALLRRTSRHTVWCRRRATVGAASPGKVGRRIFASSIQFVSVIERSRVRVRAARGSLWKVFVTKNIEYPSPPEVLWLSG